MAQNHPHRLHLLRFLFRCYCITLLVLLFCRVPSGSQQPYWDRIRGSLNLVPFRSITEYLYLLLLRPYPELLPYVWFNFVGNILLFIPLGVLLPCLSRRLRRFSKLMVSVTVLLFFLELTQLLTLLGSFDIDDIILNLLGTCLGYGIFRFLPKRWNDIQ